MPFNQASKTEHRVYVFINLCVHFKMLIVKGFKVEIFVEHWS